MRLFTKIISLTTLAVALITTAVPAHAQVRQYTFSGDSSVSIGIPDGGSNGTIVFRAGGVVAAALSTNGLAVGLGAATNTPSFTLTQTNWIDGGTYTNLTGRSIQVFTPCKVTQAAVTGVASYQLQSASWCSNTFGGGTTAASAPVSYSNSLQLIITNGGVFIFTNISGGAGNSAAILPGGYFMVF